jgi:hypothetical protein
MAGFTTDNDSHLIRSNLWSAELKEAFEDEVFSMAYVNWITEFTDGDTWNIPSIGQADVMDFDEGQRIRYTAMDTGNFTFTITDYKASATYISNKMKQDSFYMGRLISSFVPKQERAIMKALENDILAIGPDGQTASDLNAINGANHRFVASGTNEVMTVKDFALAKYSLRMAEVPLTNLVAIVHPSVAYELETLTNLVNFSNNAQWEGIVETGITTGMRFIKNIYGFDVYESNNLKQDMSETVNSVTVTTGAANLFFSAAPGDTLPFVGAIRQAPTVDSEYNKDEQRDEYVTTARYGVKLYRPENLVVVLSDTDQVS